MRSPEPAPKSIELVRGDRDPAGTMLRSEIAASPDADGPGSESTKRQFPDGARTAQRPHSHRATPYAAQAAAHTAQPLRRSPPRFPSSPSHDTAKPTQYPTAT